MPLMNVFTSAALPAESSLEALLKDLSARLSQELGKPEKYVMTNLIPRTQMTFGGTTEPACYVEIKSIGRMSPERTASLSAMLCKYLAKGLGVAPDRIYVEFADAEAHMWGHAGTTFA